MGSAVFALGVGVSAEASATTVSARMPCGYIDPGMYRHCDGGSGSTVMLDVQDIFRNLFRYCVGPGITNVQPVVRLRVIDAWWNGGVGCQPGYYGPA
ncbi:DUF6355 family natural product biosynthesis protein [Amycolatopsis sp. FU40]|uniref:DUF6355 family natural product biosynthesis protein n=1 Tax=Amycolatopsis sp. FU40 TaxID=2914159 RepID=UPI001F2858FB|nr:DUF6355 family natural product biosynthesis protein [Amycolatopsis sp. FU40]UKD58552.1 DUF6355 family natural product biosynthesis protein [Amycolatopsis sp. FU40]